MIINVKVIPNAKNNKVSNENGIFKLHVNAPALDGKANRKVIELLSEYFKVNKSKIKIVKGEKSREKLMEIDYD